MDTWPRHLGRVEAQHSRDVIEQQCAEFLNPLPACPRRDATTQCAEQVWTEREGDGGALEDSADHGKERRGFAADMVRSRAQSRRGSMPASATRDRREATKMLAGCDAERSASVYKQGVEIMKYVGNKQMWIEKHGLPDGRLRRPGQAYQGGTTQTTIDVAIGNVNGARLCRAAALHPRNQ